MEVGAPVATHAGGTLAQVLSGKKLSLRVGHGATPLRFVCLKRRMASMTTRDWKKTSFHLPNSALERRKKGSRRLVSSVFT